jgi:exodeoxyribonuclease VIII
MITKVEPNEQYHSSPTISASGLKYIWKKSVWHYLNQQPYESDSLSLGTAVHTALLEPENFYEDYIVTPKFDGRTKEGKAQKAAFMERAEKEKKQLLDADSYNKITAILDNFRKNEAAQKYTKGDIEVSHYTGFNGIEVRVRPDCINRIENFISDPKTCQDNSPKAFIRDVYKWGYHLQAAFYCDALGIEKPEENFIFIACETNHPYSVQCYTLGKEHIEKGRAAYQQAMADWQFYLDTGIALGYNGYETTDDGVIIL